ncbi:MAG: hypothetical protein ACRDAM_02045, partial [Casimicrobium sp.]
ACSKEIGFAAVAACGVATLASHEWRWNRHVTARVVALAALVLALFAMRRYATGTWLPPLSLVPMRTGYLDGIALWGTALAAVLYKHLLVTTLLSALILALIGAVCVQREARQVDLGRFVATAMSIAIFVLFALLAQAPISLAAFGDTSNVAVVSYRLFYAPFASLFVVIACVTAFALNPVIDSGGFGFKRHLDRKPRIITTLSLASLATAIIVAGFYATYTQNLAWQSMTTARRNAIFELIQKLDGVRTQSAANACVVRLNAEENRWLNYDGLLDYNVKALIGRGDALVNCILIGDPPIGNSLTRHNPCTREAFMPQRSIDERIEPVAIAGLCKHFYLR